MRRVGGALALACGLTLGLTSAALLERPAAAQPAPAGDKAAKAAAHYERGMSHYNLGRFEDAVTEFAAAFELQPEPVLLYNIAQAYRQKGSAEQAIFFYRRYLALDPRAKNRPDVEKRIKELEDIARRQAAVKDKPPVEIAPTGKPTDVRPKPTPTPVTPVVAPKPIVPEPTPVVPTPSGPTDPGPGPTASLGEGGGETISAGLGPDAGVDGAGEVGEPKKIRVAVSVGPMFPKFTSAGRPAGEDPLPALPAPTLFGLVAGGSYGFPLGKVMLDAGAQLSLGSIPWETEMAGTTTTGSSKLIGLVAGAAARYPVSKMIDVRGGLYAGVTWWSGLGENNPFTNDGVAASGAVPMPTFRFDLGADVKVWNDLYVTGGLMGSFASTTSPGLKSRVSAVRYIDLLIGVGYAL